MDSHRTGREQQICLQINQSLFGTSGHKQVLGQFQPIPQPTRRQVIVMYFLHAPINLWGNLSIACDLHKRAVDASHMFP